ncbi:MAG: CARDB domain-containing protein [Candidatus Nanoarchaeia archaeon]|nr:CARDB domain-containing protein [Candidatus Nanoarchaeia archaeon]
MKKSLIFLLISLILIPTVQSIGITPSKVTMNFEPEYRGTLIFYGMNNRDHEIIMQPFIGGELEKYMKIENPEPVKVSPKGFAEFKVSVSLPSALTTPGIVKTYFGVSEIPIEDLGSGVIAAYTSVEAIIEIKVPYPGKYAEADLIVEDVGLGEYANFKINIANLGEQAISNAQGTIVIEESNTLVKELKTDSISLASKESSTIPIKIKTSDMEGGEYGVTAIIDYDGLKATDKEIWRVGYLFVNLTNYTKEFVVDKINRWDIYVQSRWNQPIESFYAEAKLIQDGNEIDISAKTPTISLGSWESTRLVAYWDTSGLALGNYDAKINFYYKDEVSENQVKIKITKPRNKFDLRIPLLQNISSQMLLLIIIAIIVILDLIWLIWISKKKKKNVKIKKV